MEDPDTRQMMVGLIRAAASEPEAAQLIREVLTERILMPLAERVSGDQPELRASLMASQVVGIAMGRHVVQIEPLASAPRATARARRWRRCSTTTSRATGPKRGHRLPRPNRPLVALVAQAIQARRR